MTEQERHEQVDLHFYRTHIAPVLPPTVLDFHTHIWRRDQWLSCPSLDAASPAGEGGSDVPSDGRAGRQYMVTTYDYSREQLLSDAKRMFPDRDYRAVVFGQPTPAVDTRRTNEYVVESAALGGLFPLMVVGRDLLPADRLKDEIQANAFLGFKVYLNWIGDDYGNLCIDDMIGDAEMRLADELGLVVLLHVPRSARLADGDVQKGVRSLAQRYPNSRLVLAHCGRCYSYEHMRASIGAVQDLENVYFDTSMVMDPLVLLLLFRHVDSSRVLFATDLPVAAMRGRRVQIMDHWVDVVAAGYPQSAFRVPAEGIRATFMSHEIVLAIRNAGEMAGLSQAELRRVFFDNGMAVLRHVQGGQHLARHEAQEPASDSQEDGV